MVEFKLKDGAGCNASHYLPAEMEGKIVPDEHIHEHATCFNLKDKGLIVISSCGHVGIVNSVGRRWKYRASRRYMPSWAAFTSGRRRRNTLTQVVSEIGKLNPDVAHSDALQRAEFHPGSAAADAGQGSDDDDRHPHQFRHLIRTGTMPIAWRGAVRRRVLVRLRHVPWRRSSRSAAQMMDDLMYGRGSVGGPFTLTDQNGKQRSDTDFRGKLMIVYFGYTYCPDVCPTDLMAITQALDALGPAAEGVQPVSLRSIRSGTRSCWRTTSPPFITVLSAYRLTRRNSNSPMPTRRFTRKCRTSAAGTIDRPCRGDLFDGPQRRVSRIYAAADQSRPIDRGVAKISRELTNIAIPRTAGTRSTAATIVSRVRPENAPSSDVFGHNRK